MCIYSDICFCLYIYDKAALVSKIIAVHVFMPENVNNGELRFTDDEMFTLFGCHWPLKTYLHCLQKWY